jgi:hypothetical protein
MVVVMCLLPSIVCVLPAPVAPYANAVALKPSKTPGMRICVVRRYTSYRGGDAL